MNQYTYFEIFVDGIWERRCWYFGFAQQIVAEHRRAGRTVSCQAVDPRNGHYVQPLPILLDPTPFKE